MEYIGIQLGNTDPFLFGVVELIYKDLHHYSEVRPNTTVVLLGLDDSNTRTSKYLGAVCNNLGIGLILTGHLNIDMSDYPIDDLDIQKSYDQGNYEVKNFGSVEESLAYWASKISDRVFCYGADMLKQAENIPKGIYCCARPYPK